MFGGSNEDNIDNTVRRKTATESKREGLTTS